MEYIIREINDEDMIEVLNVFNYFIENSMAAYGDELAGVEVIEGFRDMAIKDAFKVIEYRGEILGFGVLRKYAKGNTFKKTCLLTYFIMPGHTAKGLGTKILSELVAKAKENRVDNLLAHISSENKRSLNFHKKHDFVECGRFRSIGRKFDKDFDIVWMQKII